MVLLDLGDFVGCSHNAEQGCPCRASSLFPEGCGPRPAARDTRKHRAAVQGRSPLGESDSPVLPGLLSDLRANPRVFYKRCRFRHLRAAQYRARGMARKQNDPLGGGPLSRHKAGKTLLWQA
jgi:hypothetical protein